MAFGVRPSRRGDVFADRRAFDTGMLPKYGMSFNRVGEQLYGQAEVQAALLLQARHIHRHQKEEKGNKNEEIRRGLGPKVYRL